MGYQTGLPLAQAYDRQRAFLQMMHHQHAAGRTMSAGTSPSASPSLQMLKAPQVLPRSTPIRAKPEPAISSNASADSSHTINCTSEMDVSTGDNERIMASGEKPPSGRPQLQGESSSSDPDPEETIMSDSFSRVVTSHFGTLSHVNNATEGIATSPNFMRIYAFFARVVDPTQAPNTRSLIERSELSALDWEIIKLLVRNLEVNVESSIFQQQLRETCTQQLQLQQRQ